MIQGIVDCFFEENEEIVVIDFKTDYVTEETAYEKALYYFTQLDTYAGALERILDKPIKERLIYFFSVNKAFNV